VFSVVFMIAGIGAAGLALRGLARQRAGTDLPASPIRCRPETHASMKATAKYFWVVMALFLVQIVLGAFTAHYQVEGASSTASDDLRVPAVLAHAQLAHAAGGAVDRHRVARHRAVHRAGHLGT
jgi:hypothetical protein